MNLDNAKQRLAAFFNSKLGVVLGVFFSLRVAGTGLNLILSGGAGPVLVGAVFLAGSAFVFNHFYEKISVQ